MPKSEGTVNNEEGAEGFRETGGRKESKRFDGNRAEVRLRQGPAAKAELPLVYNLSQTMVPCLVKNSKETPEGFPGVLVVTNPPVNAGDVRRGFHPWVRKIPAGGHGDLLQY